MWNFFFAVTLYLFALTGVDRMVTGVIAPEISPQTFKAYCLWQTLQNQAVALMAGLIEPNLTIAVFKYVTVVWCWVGGTLDFLYYMMRGYIPDWSVVWWWMPLKPTTWKLALYAIAWLLLLILLWGRKLV